jgi:hypothetical protein
MLLGEAMPVVRFQSYGLESKLVGGCREEAARFRQSGTAKSGQEENPVYRRRDCVEHKEVLELPSRTPWHCTFEIVHLIANSLGESSFYLASIYTQSMSKKTQVSSTAFYGS